MERLYTGGVPVEDKEQLFREALASYVVATEFEKYMNGDHSYILDTALKKGYPGIATRNSFLLMGNSGLQEGITFERCFEYFGCLEEFDEFASNQGLVDKILEMQTEDFIEMLEQQFNPQFPEILPLS